MRSVCQSVLALRLQQIHYRPTHLLTWSKGAAGGAAVGVEARGRGGREGPRHKQCFLSPCAPQKSPWNFGFQSTSSPLTEGWTLNPSQPPPHAHPSTSPLLFLLLIIIVTPPLAHPTWKKKKLAENSTVRPLFQCCADGKVVLAPRLSVSRWDTARGFGAAATHRHPPETTRLGYWRQPSSVLVSVRTDAQRRIVRGSDAPLLRMEMKIHGGPQDDEGGLQVWWILMKQHELG